MNKLWSLITGGSQTSRDLFNTKDGHLKTFGSFIGNLKFTQEEMAEFDEETAKGIRKFAVDTLNENTDRSKARRDMALFVIRSFVLFLFISGMVFKIDREWAAFWFSLATETHLGWLVTGVGAFFWGTHLMRSKQAAGAKK